MIANAWVRNTVGPGTRGTVQGRTHAQPQPEFVETVRKKEPLMPRQRKSIQGHFLALRPGTVATSFSLRRKWRGSHSHEVLAPTPQRVVTCCCQDSMFPVRVSCDRPVTAGSVPGNWRFWSLGRHPVPMHEDGTGKVGNGDRASERNGDRNIVRVPGVGGRRSSDLASVNQGTLYTVLSHE